jgi:hypothetical protein
VWLVGGGLVLLLAGVIALAAVVLNLVVVQMR